MRAILTRISKRIAKLFNNFINELKQVLLVIADQLTVVGVEVERF